MVDTADLKSSEHYVRAGSSPAFGTTNNINNIDTMVKEAYCSFEVSKLLKEKGFNVYGNGSLCNNVEIHRGYSPNGKIINILYGEKPHKAAYPAPTHQIAMAWLREKEIFIVINYSRFYKTYRYNIYSMDIDVELDQADYSFKSYEDACDAALLYSLENLI